MRCTPTFPLAILITLTLLSCSTEKRLGESRVQQRRYSRGFYVQHHREAKTHPVLDAGEAHGVEEDRLNLPQNGPSHSLPLEAPLGDTWVSMESQDAELHFPASLSDFSSVITVVPSVPTPSARAHDQQMDSFSGSRRGEAEALPDPVAGRHPDAVLGFVLSAGWVYGLLGSIALDYLAAFSLVGFAFALGCILSILGYSLSRRAFRMSKANPDRYPRSGLASAGRWVAGAIIIPALLWLALVLFFLLTW